MTEKVEFGEYSVLNADGNRLASGSLEDVMREYKVLRTNEKVEK